MKRIKYSFEDVQNINGERIATKVVAIMSQFDWDNGGSTNSLINYIDVVDEDDADARD